MTKKKARAADDRALDPAAQSARHCRSWMTLTRWMADPAIAYPRPDFYVGKTPMTWLSTLQAWEASRPTTSPGPAVVRRGGADDFQEAS